jgi:hypothetical protein
MKVKIQTIALLLLALTICVSAQVDLKKTAQSTMNFLVVGTSPRACALGEAFSTLGTGAEAMFYNPAGMTDSKDAYEVTVNYTTWIADIKYLSGAFAFDLQSYGKVGINLLSVDYGDIYATSLVSPADQGKYPLGYVEHGLMNNIGAYSFGISYANAVSEQFSIGGNIRYVGQNLGENFFSNGAVIKNKATKFVYDAGIKYRTGFKSFAFGMMIRNFASNLKREQIEEQLPMTFTMGAAIDLFDLVSLLDIETPKDLTCTTAFDYVHLNNYSERVNLGLEVQYQRMIALRAGYQTNRDLATWSAGVGVNLQDYIDYDVKLDYSYSSFDIFTDVSRLSLSIGFK